MAIATTLNKLQVGDTVDFSVHGTSVANLENVRVIKIVLGANLDDKTTANVNHMNIKPLVPNGVVMSTYDSYAYLVVQGNSGIQEIGFPWIIPETLSRSERRATVLVLPSLSDTQKSALSAALVAAGITDFSYSV